MYKNDYPILQRKIEWKTLIYLDSACSYLKNSSTLEWIQNYYLNFSGCSWDRQSSLLGAELHNKINKVRKNIQSFLGANSEDNIIFTWWTTDGINMVISWIDVSQINVVVTTAIEHNSNYLPAYQEAKKRNIQHLHISYDIILNLTKLEECFQGLQNSSKPFLFCITHASNITGEVFDIASISELVHSYGWYILVDDAQFVAHNQEDVIRNNIDFLVFSGHKIWWPTWIGCLFIKKWCETLIVYSSKIGGGTISTMKKWEPKYKWLPDFLEWWVQDFAGILWLGASISYRDSLWTEAIQSHISQLVEYFWEKYRKMKWDIYFIVRSEKWVWIITLEPKKFQSIDFHQFCNYFLDDVIISFRTGTVCADNYVNSYIWHSNIFRLSFWLYNTLDDIDSFYDALNSYIESL